MKLAKLFGAAALFASMVATAHAANTTVTVKEILKKTSRFW